MKFAANLSFLFQDVPMMERFRLAAEAGFKGVEILFPYEFQPAEIAAGLSKNGLTQALINLPPGDWSKGERGLSGLPGREDEFRASFERGLAYAEALGCNIVHCMAGLAIPGGSGAALEAYKANLDWAARAAESAGVTVTIEPLNHRDMPGYLLTTPRQAEAIIAEIGRPNLKLQYDLYHAQIMEGDITRSIQRLQPIIGHVQIAGVPDRHEPDESELDIFRCLETLRATGYRGWIGCEYRPRGGTREGLGWMERARSIVTG